MDDDFVDWDLDDDEVYGIVCHEAGHAVAALIVKRPLNEIFIHPDNGYTHHGCDDGTDYGDLDRRFIVYAGSWAQAFARTQKSEGPTFPKLVAELMWEHHFCDWVEFQLALGREIRGGDCHALRIDSADGNEPPYDTPLDPAWDVQLKGMWPTIQTFAESMLAGQYEIDIGHDQALCRVDKTLWRRRDWQPAGPDEGPLDCCEELVRLFDERRALEANTGAS